MTTMIPSNFVTHVTPSDHVSPPILPAISTADGTCCVAWCRYCDCFHTHGNGSGGRAAHCFVPDSPYKEHGYVLDVRPGLQGSLRPPKAERRKPMQKPSWGGGWEHGWTEERDDTPCILSAVARAQGLWPDTPRALLRSFSGLSKHRFDHALDLALERGLVGCEYKGRRVEAWAVGVRGVRFVLASGEHR